MTVTNPTIASTGTKTFSSSSSTTLTLYGVQSENIQKTSGFIELPLPLQDSDSKIVMDLLGSSRNINIRGIVSEDDVGVNNLYKYASDIVGLTGLITGNQKVATTNPTGYTYNSEVLNYGNSGTTTIKVLVMDASVERAYGNPTSFSYSINLLEFDGSV